MISKLMPYQEGKSRGQFKNFSFFFFVADMDSPEKACLFDLLLKFFLYTDGEVINKGKK